jgi:hypothetical protein
MLRKALAAIATAAILVAVFVVPPADAKKGKKGNGGRQEATTVAPSFNRPITGRPMMTTRPRYERTPRPTISPVS